MMLKFSTLIIIFALTLCHPRSGSAAIAEPPLGLNPNFSHIPLNLNNSVGEVLSIAQDKNGFLWFGGRTGLARYDGYRFHTYKTNLNDPTALAVGYITHVFEDSYGELWIATYGGGVARLNRQLDNFHRYTYANEKVGEINNQRFDQIFEDAQKNLWIVGTGGIALYDRDKDKFVRYLQDSTVINELFFAMIQLEPNQYLFLAPTAVYLWDRLKNNVEKIVPDPSKPKSNPFATTRALIKDAKGNIWIGHKKGLCRFILSSKTFEIIPLNNKVTAVDTVSVWKIMEDTKGILWIATDGNGLMYFDPATNILGGYTKSTSLSSSLTASVIRSVFEDKNGDLWVGTYPAGIDHYDKSNNYITYFSNFKRNKEDNFANNIWSFSEDTANNLWLGVDKLGLVYFDRKNNTFTQTYDGFDFSNQGFPHNALSLLLDSKENLWIGSWQQGVTRFNVKTKAYTHFNPLSPHGSKFVGDSVWSIIESKSGDIYFGTMNNGFIRYNYDTDTFTNFFNQHNGNKSPNNNAAWDIIEAHDGRLWIGSNNGVYVFDPKTELFKFYKNEPGNLKSLSNNIALSLFEDSKKRMWISTSGGGLNLYHPEDDSFTQIRVTDGLKDDDVRGIEEDDNGTLWVSGTTGITAFNPDTRSFHTYSEKNWLQRREFNHGSHLKLKSGELVFGGADGMNIFNPKNVSVNTKKPPIYFTELDIFNTSIKASEKNTAIKTDILEADKIILTHNDSMFSLTFSALNYRTHEDNQYRYQLEGFDTEWHNDSKENKATYTHLDAGKYKFVVMASNNDGVWGDEKKSIEIIVLPAPWKTGWAYAIYIGIVLGCMLWFIVAQRNKVLYEKRLNNKLIDLDKLKDEFMANTSHELRTPLNGIIGLTEALHNGSAGTQSAETLHVLNLILSCGRRLERLTNNILNFSKSKTSSLPLECSGHNIYFIIEGVVAQCSSTINKNNVRLINTMPQDLPLVYCDATRTSEIFYTIITNAIKFTETGSITIFSVESELTICINVKDTGIGIAQEKLSQLCNSFTQLSDSGVYAKNGTGLSLALAKHFITEQNGQIDVESIINVGSTFKVTLPKATAQQIAENPATVNSPSMTTPAQSEEPSISHNANTTPANTSSPLSVFYPKNYEENKIYKKILVVDDESVNRIVLRYMLLKTDFIVFEAENGLEAVTALDNGFKCDLILLDIMMPKMSGTDVCKHIRKNHSKQDLPIIFISAKSQPNDIAECFDIEGNDFLSKPVNRDDLVSRINFHLTSLNNHLTQKT